MMSLDDRDEHANAKRLVEVFGRIVYSKKKTLNQGVRVRCGKPGV